MSGADHWGGKEGIDLGCRELIVCKKIMFKENEWREFLNQCGRMLGSILFRFYLWQLLQCIEILNIKKWNMMNCICDYFLKNGINAFDRNE